MSARKPFQPFLVLASVVVLTVACASTPDSRIQEKQSLFDSYSEAVQANLRRGIVAVGYDEDMVRIALGEPKETSIEINETGETVSWGYIRSRPGFSVGVGGGSFGGRGGVGAGVGMGSGSKTAYTAIIEFREGKVTSARYFDN